MTTRELKPLTVVELLLLFKYVNPVLYDIAANRDFKFTKEDLLIVYLSGFIHRCYTPKERAEAIENLDLEEIKTLIGL